MGRPSDDNLDRELESPIDDAWSTDADEPVAAISDDALAKAADHERTTAASGVDRTARKIVDDLFAEATDHDRTTVAGNADRVSVDHDRTTFGMGVATGTRKPITFFPAKPSPAELPDQKHGLVQPERSPLALVMGDLAASTGAPQAHASGDSSRFIAALVGDEPPALERVAEDESPITAIPPKLMARRRRRWIAAGALATTVVAGTLFGMTFRSAPAPAAPTQSSVLSASTATATPALTTPTPTTPTPAPAPPAPAQQPAPPTSPQESDAPPEAAPAARVDVAVVAPSRTITKPSTRPAIAKKTVATSNTSVKRPSSTRMAAKPKAAAAKPSTTTSTVTVKKKKKRSFF